MVGCEAARRCWFATSSPALGLTACESVRQAGGAVRGDAEARHETDANKTLSTKT